MDEKQCQFIRNGRRCQAWAIKNSQFCFAHSPDRKRERMLARSKGGKSPKRNYNVLEPIKIESHKDVVKLVSQTINEVRQGMVDVRIANCIFYGGGILIRALEFSDLEKRLEELEKAVFK